MLERWEELLEENLSKAIGVGSTVNGRIVQISDEGLYVNVGTKSEGFLPWDEVSEQDADTLKQGDLLRVKVIKIQDDALHLSKKAADYDEGLVTLQERFQKQEKISIKILKKIKNGFLASYDNIGQGFIHERNFPEGEPKMGEEWDAYIREYSPSEKRLIFTRRRILDEQREQKIIEEFDSLRIGETVEGKVTKLSSFGAFVQITDALSGLLHVNEIDWAKPKKISDILKPGSTLQVQIINKDDQTRRIYLSRKRLLPHPMDHLVVGEIYEGKVENVTDFGGFVRLPIGVTGLVYIGELSWKRFDHPRDIIGVGQTIKVKVINIDRDNQKVSLSLKALEHNIWDDVHEKYAVGDTVKVCIKKMVTPGIIVALDTLYEGFIPRKEVARDKAEIERRRFRIGEEVSAVILKIDSKERRILLSIARAMEKAATKETRKPREKHQEEGEYKRPQPMRVTIGDLIEIPPVKGVEGDKEEQKAEEVSGRETVSPDEIEAIRQEETPPDLIVDAIQEEEVITETSPSQPADESPSESRLTDEAEGAGDIDGQQGDVESSIDAVVDEGERGEEREKSHRETISNPPDPVDSQEGSGETGRSD